MAKISVTILGCGSSGGVPRLGGIWGACDPENPKNTRRRCSILVERETDDGTTRVLIDTSPDMRAQLLDANVGTLDAVIFTHAHADHTHGLDDLRMIAFNMHKRLPVWADGPTQTDLLQRFLYAFETPEGSDYPPILNLHDIAGTIEITGAGGPLHFEPIPVQHGRIMALGLRFHDIAYLPDVSDIPGDSWDRFKGLRCWILDALRYNPHPSHVHFERSLEWITQAAPTQAVLTNMHIDLDYETVQAETPSGVRPAFDGMTLVFED